ncbi:MAG TPA: alpha/beta fold hydrolase [Burkholderiaceae bacterium]|nr:alpha/beta fold hydrolase [Burkholderiaceae bacterium]HQR76413.1 alpha/beta fold hydrolase [Burkholderiaceae bacterium]
MHKTTITAADGFELHATLFGDSATARAGVLIAAAMGVEQTYYADFAHWLAAQGFWVVTFDYRGVGQSRPDSFRRSLRGLDASVMNWAQRDAAAIVDFMAERLGDRPLLWVGHSLGGQILGLLDRPERIRAIMTVAAGSGYWRDYVPALRRFAPALWYAIVPLVLPLFGYFPGRRLGLIGDVPQGVMRQWRAWCLDPDYLFGVEDRAWRVTYARLTQPILSLSFTDDEYLSARNIESLHAFYAGAAREMRRLAPGDVGADRIGHFGFFRRRHAESLWPQARDWLVAQSKR